MATLKLKLFITGRTVRSETAIRELHDLLDQLVDNQYELTITDVLENPQSAEDHLIMATPTLIKQKPLPTRRIIGDLSDRNQLLTGLDLEPSPSR